MTTRRRVLTILAGAAALPALGLRAANAAAEWRGIALGANARIILDHPNADSLLALAVKEIHRLEGIFSLYQSDSQLAHLNATGTLDNPVFEMLELLSICSQINARTKGAFDPTIQPLWSLYAERAVSGNLPTGGQISTALGKTGWSNVAWSTGQVALSKPGMQMTLNGIAQGYIADKVADLLRANGVENVLVNTGEIAALGLNPEGTPWAVHLKNAQTLNLTNRAVATSAPLGTTFDNAGAIGHILDPKTGYPVSLWSQVSVTSQSACQADALSTAFCTMSRSAIDNALAGTSDQVFLIDAV